MAESEEPLIPLSETEMSQIRKLVQSQTNLTPFRHLQSSTNADPSRRISLANFNAKMDDDDDDNDATQSGSLEMNKLVNMRTEYYELFEFLTKTMRGEGNTSVLLVGKHGYGKSSLLCFALNQLRLKFGDASFITIYLNGKLQTTDVQALYELVGQLSHQKFDAESEVCAKQSAFGDNLAYLVEQLKKISMAEFEKSSVGRGAIVRPIFIVLDNFELFCNRAKQTLLYNLFDLLQSESSLFNIIGLTTVKSVDQLLEKRIRSRFIHKKILVNSQLFNFAMFKRILYHTLVIDSMTIDDYNKGKLRHINKALLRNVKLSKEMIDSYNRWMDDEILSSRKLLKYLQRLTYLGVSPAQFLSIAAVISSFITHEYYLKRGSGRAELNVSNDRRGRRRRRKGAAATSSVSLSASASVPNPQSDCIDEMIIDRIQKTFFTNPQLQMITDLSVNELLLLIIGCKLDHTGNPTFNFEIIMKRLKTIQNSLSTNIIMHSTSKLLYYQSFVNLIKYHYFIQSSSAQTNGSIIIQNTSSLGFGSGGGDINDNIRKIFNRNYAMVRLNTNTVTSDDILRYIQTNVHHCPTWISEWLNKNTTHIHS